ncbi:MAG: MFS transporter [Pseudomonadota bacterium]
MADTAAPQSSAALSFCAPERRRGILIAAILASSLSFIDGTVVSIALPAMRDSLGASFAQAQWFSNAYILMLSALILTGGALGDRFGLARIFGLGIAVFIAGSLATALAPDPSTMIAARAFKGVGAALMVPGSLAIISRAYPAEDRGRAIGIWAAASAVTTALGPIIGGLVLTFAGPEFWRWIFAVNLPLGLIALTMLKRSVARDSQTQSQPVDWIGATLATIGLGGLAFGLTALQLGGAALPTLGLGLAALTCFILHEQRTPAPMMPLTLFSNRQFAAANAATLCVYTALAAVMFYLPQTIIPVWGITPIEASAAFAPLSVFISLLSARVGRLADRVGAVPVIAAGSFVVAAGYLGVALTTPWAVFWSATMPAMALVGLGMGIIVAPLSAAVMGAVDPARSGVASGINNAISRSGSLLGIAIFGLVATAVYASVGGELSFGAAGDSATHAQAANAAFARIAYACAALCALGGALMLVASRKAGGRRTTA